MYIAYLCIAGCVFGIMVGVFGFLTSRCKSCWVAFPLGLLSFLAGLLAVIAGVAVFGGNVASVVKNQICGDATGGASFIKAQYGPNVDEKFCTADCPCAATTGATTQADFNTRAAAMKKAGDLTRTGVTFTGTGSGDAAMTSYTQCFKKLSKATQTENAAI